MLSLRSGGICGLQVRFLHLRTFRCHSEQASAQGNRRAMNRLTEMKRMGNRRANVARPTRQQAKDECVIC